MRGGVEGWERSVFYPPKKIDFCSFKPKSYVKYVNRSLDIEYFKINNNEAVNASDYENPPLRRIGLSSSSPPLPCRQIMMWAEMGAVIG